MDHNRSILDLMELSGHLQESHRSLAAAASQAHDPRNSSILKVCADRLRQMRMDVERQVDRLRREELEAVHHSETFVADTGKPQEPFEGEFDRSLLTACRLAEEHLLTSYQKKSAVRTLPEEVRSVLTEHSEIIGAALKDLQALEQDLRSTVDR